MGVEPHEGGLALDGAGRLEEPLPLRGIGPPSVQIRHEPARALDPQKLDLGKARLAHLVLELPGQVEEGRGEVVAVCRVPMLLILEISSHDGRVVGIAQQIVGDAVEERSEAPYRGRHEKPARLEHAGRLAEGHDALRALDQMIERAQEQDGVGAGIGIFEPARIAQPAGGQGSVWLARRGRLGLLDVERHGIDQMHAIAQGGEPAGVDSGAAPHVQHGSGRGGEAAENDLLGARELDDAVALEEALGLAALVVVGLRLAGDRLARHLI